MIKQTYKSKNGIKTAEKQALPSVQPETETLVETVLSASKVPLAVASKPSAAGSSPSRPLPLESGEFMHSREFLRRYERMPQVKKAELIEGIVYMGSPVSVRHAKPDGIIQVWLGTYASRHPDTEALPNATVILDAENTVQPDALLR